MLCACKTSSDCRAFSVAQYFSKHWVYCTISIGWQNLTLLINPTVTEDISAASPPLPFVYLCPSKAPYTISGPVYVGCGDDISDASLPLQTTPDGLKTRAGDACAQQQLVTVKVRSASGARLPDVTLTEELQIWPRYRR